MTIKSNECECLKLVFNIAPYFYFSLKIIFIQCVYFEDDILKLEDGNYKKSNKMCSL